MDVLQFTQSPEIRALVAELRLARLQEPARFQRTAIKDAAGHQYVDIVMEGGGTLGIALLGYLYIMEEMNFRFLNIAGTSAGSIVALLLAAAGPIDQSKSLWLIEQMANKNFSDFIDGDEDAKAFTKIMLDQTARKGEKIKTSSKVIDNIKKDYGLNPGQAFYDWIQSLLASKQIFTLQDIENLRKQIPEGINCMPNRWETLALITADVSTGTKVSFPKFAPLYWENPSQVNPAAFVRASMSVPLFFYPFEVDKLPEGPSTVQQWSVLANYHGPIPDRALFIDGGALSNFPIAILRPEGVDPDVPLFAVKMGSDRNSFNACENFGSFAGAVLGTMMGFYDNEILVQHPELKDNITVIDTGAYHWLDFYMSDSDKLDLFTRGAKAASKFLLES